MFDIYSEIKDGIAIVHISGTLSIDTVKDFDDTMNELLPQGPESIALDCAFLDGIDSYAVNHMFKFSKKARAEDIPLFLLDMNDVVGRVREITRITSLYHVMSKAAFEKEYLGNE